MENEGGIGSAGGMVERKESYNSGRSREMGGPRPPTVSLLFSSLRKGENVLKSSYPSSY